MGAEIALFGSLTVLRYIWWTIDKVGAEIAFFASVTVRVYDGICQFLLCFCTFGGPMTIVA